MIRAECPKCEGPLAILAGEGSIETVSKVNGVESRVPSSASDVLYCPEDGWRLPIEERKQSFAEKAAHQKELVAAMVPRCLVDDCKFQDTKSKVREHMHDEHGISWPGTDLESQTLSGLVGAQLQTWMSDVARFAGEVMDHFQTPAPRAGERDRGRV